MIDLGYFIEKLLKNLINSKYVKKCTIPIGSEFDIFYLLGKKKVHEKKESLFESKWLLWWFVVPYRNRKEKIAKF